MRMNDDWMRLPHSTVQRDRENDDNLYIFSMLEEEERERERGCVCEDRHRNE
jgi:hypothetical protein